MNEQEMTDLLDRATRELRPDVGALVAGGLRRGRVRRRRRQVAQGVSAIAAAGLVIVGSTQLLGSGLLEDRSGRPVGPAGSPGVPSADVSTANPTAKARLAVTTAQVPSAFASLEPGRVSAPSAKSGPDSAPVVDFTWNGFGIRVGITPDDYTSGRSVPDPATRCAQEVGGGTCEPGPNGTVVSTSAGTNPAVDGGTEVRSAWVFRPDGWDVLVMAYNGPAKSGPPTADQPPFTVAELQRIAGSDVWFG